MKTEKKRLTREESQQQTREQLLETARQLFVAGGYGGTSIRDIASQAGYSQGAFYSNFASKEALLLQLLQRHMEAEATQLTALAQSDIDTPERVLTALEAWARCRAWRARPCRQPTVRSSAAMSSVETRTLQPVAPSRQPNRAPAFGGRQLRARTLRAGRRAAGFRAACATAASGAQFWQPRARRANKLACISGRAATSRQA